MPCGSLEYAQARLQARHGQRASELDWQRLESTREFGALLDAARNSPLRAWVVGLTPHSGAHEIEAVLRRHWRAQVDELTGWMPPAWQPALAWCAWLPLLPALQHLARGGAVRPWMRQVPLLQAVCDATSADLANPGQLPAPAARDALRRDGAGALAGAWAAPQALGEIWWAEWRRRMPPQRGSARDKLHTVLGLLHAHGRAFAAAPAGSGVLLRRTLYARLAPWVRRATAEPARPDAPYRNGQGVRETHASVAARRLRPAPNGRRTRRPT